MVPVIRLLLIGELFALVVGVHGILDFGKLASKRHASGSFLTSVPPPPSGRKKFSTIEEIHDGYVSQLTVPDIGVGLNASNTVVNCTITLKRSTLSGAAYNDPGNSSNIICEFVTSKKW